MYADNNWGYMMLDMFAENSELTRPEVFNFIEQNSDAAGSLILHKAALDAFIEEIGETPFGMRVLKYLLDNVKNGSLRKTIYELIAERKPEIFKLISPSDALPRLESGNDSAAYVRL